MVEYPDKCIACDDGEACREYSLPREGSHGWKTPGEGDSVHSISSELKGSGVFRIWPE